MQKAEPNFDLDKTVLVFCKAFSFVILCVCVCVKYLLLVCIIIVVVLTFGCKL